MRKIHVLSVVICLALAGFGQASAQSNSTDQSTSTSKMMNSTMTMPRIIWIYREEVKPARTSAHDKVEQGFAQLWASLKVQPFIGMEAVSGNASEALFISGYDSFATYDKDFQIFMNASNGSKRMEMEQLEKQEADLVNGVRSVIATYRPDMSYLADRFMNDLPRSRYIQIETMRVRQGKDDSLAEGAKMFLDAYQKAGIQHPWVIYQVLSGSPAGTYMVFTPMNSMKDMDDELTMHQKVAEAMGEEKMKDMMKGSGEIFSFIERDIYSFNPKISHVSQEFAAMDPEFWGPQTRTLARTAATEARTPKSTKKSPNK